MTQILFTGIFFLPESPRYFVKKGNVEKARGVLSRLRGQPVDSEYVETELAELVAYNEFERQINTSTSWFGTWAMCFKGGLSKSNSNLRRTILGTSLQMMQQWSALIPSYLQA